MTRIEQLASANDAAIREILDAAFGPDRHGRTAYRVRIGMAWLTDLSFSAYSESDELVGTLQCWPVALHLPDGTQAPLIMVGPVAVAPGVQHRGIGRALMDRLIEKVDTHRREPLMMIGDPDYYGRFWRFSAERTAGWTAPGPVERHRLLARAGAGDELPVAGMLGPRGVVASEAMRARGVG